MIKLIIFILSSFCFGKVDRISDQEMDISKTKVLYVTPGRSTLLDFPCEISHSILGLHGDIKTIIGPDSKKTMTLWVSGNSSQPTNLTIRCDNEVFVFDVYPNSHTHQDYVNITSYFDKRSQRSKKLLSSSKTAANSKKSIKKKLVSSSVGNSIEPHKRKKKLVAKGQK